MLNTVVLLACTSAVDSTAAMAAPVSAVDAFCSNMHDYLLVNDTVKTEQHYKLCMDVASLSWKRDEVEGPNKGMSVIFDGSKNVAYHLTAPDAATGRRNCSAVPGAPASPAQLPFDFIAVDATAKKTDAPTSLDNRTAELWESARAAHAPFPAEDMRWYLSTPDAQHKQDMLQTDCVQRYGTRPGDSGNATKSVGTRDFSNEYMRGVPAGTFEPPAGVHCASPPSWAPATDCGSGCAAGSMCCRDPAALGKGSGACYKVAACDAIHDKQRSASRWAAATAGFLDFSAAANS